MRRNLPAILAALVACAATSFAGTKCKYGAKVSRLQVLDGGEVTWSLAKRPATCVEHFQVCWGVVGEGGASCVRAPPSSRSHHVHGLKRCRWYNVSVAAIGDPDKPVSTASALHFVVEKDLAETSVAVRPNTVLTQPNRVVVTIGEVVQAEASCFSHYTVCWSAPNSEETCERKKSYETTLETGWLQLCTNYTFTFWTSILDMVNTSTTSLYQFTGVGEVRDVTITMVSSNTIGVRWQPPSAGGDCVDHYRIAHDSGSKEVPASTTEYLITSLLPCKHYFVEVQAISANGTWSSVIQRRAITRPTVPGVVQDLRVRWTSSRRVLVQWRAPEETRFCHVRYSVCWRKSGLDNERCARHRLSPYPSLAISKLKPCTEYTVKVAVLGAEKVLGDATAIRIMTGPEPAASLRVEQMPAGEKVLRWESPACAQSYQVCWGTWGGRGRHMCSNTTDTSFIVTGRDLGPGALTYSVVAVGKTGASSDRALVDVAI